MTTPTFPAVGATVRMVTPIFAVGVPVGTRGVVTASVPGMESCIWVDFEGYPCPAEGIGPEVGWATHATEVEEVVA